MDSKNEYAVPGPSNMDDKTSDSKKTIRWDTSVDEKEETREQQKTRRQSLMGTSGYVSQLLDQYVAEEEKDTTFERKPIRDQSFEERKASIKAVETDVGFYMKEASTAKPRKSTSLTSRPSLVPLMQTSEEKFQAEQVIPLPDDSRPSSEWKPSHLLDSEKKETEEETSWTGTYIVGKDYWTPAMDYDEKKTGKVFYAADDAPRPWYDMPIQGDFLNDITLRSMKSKSLEKIETLKGEIDEEFDEKRKHRLISAATARQEQLAPDEWSEEFRDCFRDASRSNKFSHGGAHILLADADKWLEKAGILDYTDITLVHTGLCFITSGGSRHRGLSFDEFTKFLQMISNIRKMPLRDVVRRMKACVRNPNDYVVK